MNEQPKKPNIPRRIDLTEKMVAMINDKRLQDMAIYQETRGLLQKASPKQVGERFKDFKRMVKVGEFGIDELERRIYSEHGIVEEDPNAVVALNISQGGLEDFLDIMDQLIDEDAKKNKGRRDKGIK